MNHKYTMEGRCYRLRPAKISDAAFIVELRAKDAERSRYIHPISADVSKEEMWMRNYLERENDYFFIIENRFTGEAEGTVGLYNFEGDEAEWGRWFIARGSLAAAESAYLIWKFGLEKMNLREVVCRTFAENEPVVSFHRSTGALEREILKNHYQLGDRWGDSADQYTNKENFQKNMQPVFLRQINRNYKRMIKKYWGEFTFDHIGVAVPSIAQVLPYYLLEGYEAKEDPFEDPLQGVRGQFVEREGSPRLELLENLPGSDTLNTQLKQRQKMYHRAYYVGEMDEAVACFCRNRAKVISAPKKSIYFGKRVCFLLLPSREIMELVER